MRTEFSPEQLLDSKVAESEKILRKCVHCGFCTATCPTYVTLGNELDSPRGRIYLIKDMLENSRPADEKTVKHLDRCLSCLACTTTCPSGVDYMHLIDNARAYIEKTYDRPFADRFVRSLLANILPYPKRFRLALRFAQIGRPFAPLFKKVNALKPMGAMLELAPHNIPTDRSSAEPGTRKVDGAKRARVAILSGCAQPVLNPAINAATMDLLNRFHVEVVIPEGEVCCGALTHHMGREEAALQSARQNVDVWTKQVDEGGLDAIIITASGCGTTIKDYGHMLAEDKDYADKAKRVSELAKDITEFLVTLDLPEKTREKELIVTYHSACSMQHGQKITNAPKDLLRNAGFKVREPAESHLCCGSAGTYNILQSEIADKLKTRKVDNLERTKPDLIAAGNIGCITQIGSGTEIPIVHTIELLNWAYGGPKPKGVPAELS